MLAKLLGMRIFDIEVSGLCNLSCLFCPREQLPETGNMDENTFNCFLRNVPLRTTDGLMFVGIGEPLLNPHLPDFLAKVTRRYPGLFTLVTTNGTLLTPRIVPRLLEAGLNTLDVSFNGIDPETYQRLMKGACFERTLTNIEYTAREIRRTKSPTKLQINYIVTEENAKQQAKIQAFWQAHGIEHFRMQAMHTRGGDIHLNGMTPVDQPGLQGRSCEKFQFMPFITWRGDLLYCSHDIHHRHIIGNICRDTWSVIEQRKKKVLQNHQWPKMCEGCVDTQRHELERKLSSDVIQEVKRRLLVCFRKNRK